MVRGKGQIKAHTPQAAMEKGTSAMEKKHIRVMIPLLVMALTLPILGCGNTDEAVNMSGSSAADVIDTAEEVESLDGSDANDSSQPVTVDEETGEYTVSDKAYDSKWLLENAEDIGADTPEFADEYGYYEDESDKQEVMDNLTALTETFAKTLFTIDGDTSDYTETVYAMTSPDVDNDSDDLSQIRYYYPVIKESAPMYIKTDIRQFYVYKDIEGCGRMIRVAGFIDATINDDQTDNQDKDVANWFELHFISGDGSWYIAGTYLRNRFAMENAKFLHDPSQPEDNTYYISMVGWYRGMWNFDGEDENYDMETVNPGDVPILNAE